MPISYSQIDQDTLDLSHLDGLCALFAAVEQSDAAPYLDPPNRDFFARTLGTSYANVLACDGDGDGDSDKIVGYAVLQLLSEWPDYMSGPGINEPNFPCQLSAMILFTLVHPDYRTQGINKRMTQLRLEAAKAAGVKYLFSTVHPNNTASLSHLTAIGMKAIAQRPMFDQQVLRNLMFMAL